MYSSGSSKCSGGGISCSAGRCDEGTAIPEGEDDQLETPRHKPGPITPKLRRFATTAAWQFHFVGCPLVEEYSVKDYHYTWGDPTSTGRLWQE